MMSVEMLMAARRLANPVDPFQVLLPRIAAQHSFQDIRGTGLHGQVDLIAERGMGIDGLNYLRRKIARVRGGKAHAPDALDLRHPRQ